MTVQTIDRKKLIEVLLNNPDLPIIANVYSEVVADDGCAFWYGDVKDLWYIDTLWAGKHQIWSLGDALDDMMEFLYWEFPKKEPEKLTINNVKEIRLFIKNLPWKKYIVLTVLTPDSLEGDNNG